MIEKVLAKDALSRAFAVVLALVVWVQVINDKNPLERKVFTFDVEVANLSSDKVLMSVSPAKVSVTLEGRATTLSRLEHERVKTVADLSKAGTGQTIVPLSFEVPYGVRVVELEPKAVVVDLDLKSSSTVPVNVEARGEPNEDFQKGTPLVSPQTIEVRGPSRLVNRVQWATGAVDVTGATQQVVASVDLTPKDSQGNEVKGVTLDPQKVEVTVPLTALPPAKLLPVHPRITGSPKPGYRVARVTSTPAQVKVRASEAILRNLTSLSTEPVDVSGKDSTFTWLSTLEIPSGVTAPTSQVTVRVEIAEDIVQRTFSVPVQISSYPSRLKWDIQPSTVDVILSGRSDVLSQIQESDVEAYIDAEGKSEGEYEMVVAVKVPYEVQIDVRPPKVRLTLTKR